MQTRGEFPPNTVAYEPAIQRLQVSGEPSAVEYDPGLQAIQALEFMEGEYVPALQLRHVIEAEAPIAV